MSVLFEKYISEDEFIRIRSTVCNFDGIIDNTIKLEHGYFNGRIWHVNESYINKTHAESIIRKYQ